MSRERPLEFSRAPMLALFLALQIAGAATAQTVDFEPDTSGCLPDGSTAVDDLAITNQFQSLGIVFGVDNNLDLVPDTGISPFLEARGSDGTDAFAGGCGVSSHDTERTDRPQSLGSFFLRTRAGVGTSDSLLITYATPFSHRASGELWDIDGIPSSSEEWMITAFGAGGSRLASPIVSPLGTSTTCENALESGAWPWVVDVDPSGQPIAYIRIDYLGAGTTLLALDNFHPAGEEPCALFRHLVGYWPFDEEACATGCNRTDVARSHFSTVTTSSLVPGIKGGAAEFDGVDDGVEVEAHPALDFTARGMTIFAWLYGDWTSGTGYGPLVGKDLPGKGGYRVGIDAAGILYAYLDDGTSCFTVTASSAIPAAAWTQVAFVFDCVAPQSVDVSLYANGVPVGGQTISLGVVGNTSPLTIGYDQASRFEGVLDDVAVFDSPFTDATVAQAYGESFAWCAKCLQSPFTLDLAYNSFSTGEEGWTVLTSNGFVPLVWNGDSIQREDKASGGTSFVAPWPFLGDLRQAHGISFDWCADMIGKKRGVSVTLYQGGSVKWIAANLAVTDDYENQWLTFDFPFTNAASWLTSNGTFTVRASDARIFDILSNVTRIRITGESMIGIGETVKLDNVHLYYCPDLDVPTREPEIGGFAVRTPDLELHKEALFKP